MLEAQWCWYCCKLDISGGIQSVEDQVGQKAEPAEEIITVHLCKLSEAMSCLKLCLACSQSGIHTTIFNNNNFCVYVNLV